jgi:hypothetical protein
MEKFYNKISMMFNYDFLHHDNLYLDIATKICPNYSSYTPGNKDKAQVYLFWQCYLEKSLEVLYNNKPRGPSGRT